MTSLLSYFGGLVLIGWAIHLYAMGKVLEACVILVASGLWTIAGDLSKIARVLSKRF